MKHTKDRVIAIDYFRGICILIVVINHAALFSAPFVYITGAGNLATSAAEMFFLLSGITLGVIRGEKIVSDFWSIAKKTWRRAASLYLINTLAVLASLCLALFLNSKNLTTYIPGTIASFSPFELLAKIMTLRYSFGWANFLMYYAAFLAIAPAALYILRTRLWTVVPLASAGLYALASLNLYSAGGYHWFAIWQLYFFTGLVLARFRLPIIGWLYSRPRKALIGITGAVLVSTSAVLLISGLMRHSGQSVIYSLFLNNRQGLLRPAAALLVLGSVYLAYQNYKHILLARTGRFVNAMGRDTLWIFVAQAFAIPLLAALPVGHNLFNNFILTSILLTSMWLVTKRRAMADSLRTYTGELKTSYNQAKYAYIYGSEDEA